jgi:hypothetical protein
MVGGRLRMMAKLKHNIRIFEIKRDECQGSATEAVEQSVALARYPTRDFAPSTILFGGDQPE